MNLAKFGNLISYITMISNRNGAQVLPVNDIDELGKMIVDMIDTKFEPATHEQIVAACGHQVGEMMRAMRDGKKIEAIKACRMLTGLGLKEAKDMIEDAGNNYNK